jgi:hypothetical protein
MIENSSAGLVLLEAEVTVTVTGEEHHQRELARYAVTAGGERHVAVELGWCTIGSGKYRGQPAIEVRLDGYRVGELTYLMSQRYAPLVTHVTGQSGRPGCQAKIQLGARGLEVTLRLPRSGDVLQQPQRKPFMKRPGWIAAAAVALVLFIASLANNDEETPSSDAAGDRTTTASATPTTTTPPPTTTTTTTTVVPAPPPVVVDPQPVETVTEEPAPPPPPAPEPEPAPACDPNYSGCVPVASDVDCKGGSGNGPAYVDGPVQVIGSDIYDLDRDGDGTACDS